MSAACCVHLLLLQPCTSPISATSASQVAIGHMPWHSAATFALSSTILAAPASLVAQSNSKPMSSMLNLTGDVGEIMPDAGNAFICGHSMQQEMAKARQLVGYCPQFDALPGTLTGSLTTPPPPPTPMCCACSFLRHYVIIAWSAQFSMHMCDVHAKLSDIHVCRLAQAECTM